MKLLTKTVLLTAAATLMMAGSARADTFTYSLTVNNGGFGNPPGPYGSVVVSLDATHTVATLTLTGNQVGSNVYLFGDGGTFGFNTNGAVTINSINGTNSYTDSGFGAFSPGPWSNGGSGNEDGFGSFSNTINSHDGYQSSVNSLTVQITLNSGSWANAAAVLADNGSGNFVAGHVFLAQLNGNGTITNTGSTGFATDDTGGQGKGVPDGGSTAALLGSALLGLGLLRRRFGKA